jgi:hypothetical protein
MMKQIVKRKMGNGERKVVNVEQQVIKQNGYKDCGHICKCWNG